MTVSIRLIASIVAAGALALSVGCGRPPEEKAAGGEEALSSKSPATPPSGASDAVIGRELPPNFPDDVPRLPKAQILETRATPDMGFSVSMLVKDDPGPVMKFYADQFASEGWTTNITESPDGDALFADKGKRTAALLVRETQRGTQVQLVLGQM